MTLPLTEDLLVFLLQTYIPGDLVGRVSLTSKPLRYLSLKDQIVRSLTSKLVPK